jgi:hypothetical protein
LVEVEAKTTEKICQLEYSYAKAQSSQRNSMTIYHDDFFASFATLREDYFLFVLTGDFPFFGKTMLAFREKFRKVNFFGHRISWVSICYLAEPFVRSRCGFRVIVHGGRLKF